ncbi:MAG: FAD-dependent oxidoreductase, partial [Planctomycetes bacterium]|nr:FAD-dependent oxidoreductase [Planctomycetota bacterium]
LERDGVIWNVPPRPYGVSYRSLIPKPEECTNLLVPVCLSATHAAHGSIRMEPVFMQLGQAAAMAAGIAIKEGVPVQAVPYAQVRDLLQAAKGIDLHGECRHHGSSRRCTSLSTNCLAILFIDRLVDGLWLDTKRRQFLRVHPDAHGILAQSKVRNLSNTRDALQRLNDIDISVIG